MSAQTYKVLEVNGPREWEGKYGTSYDWRVRLLGEDDVPLPQLAVLTTKKPDNGPKLNTTETLKIEPHPRLENMLKATREQQGNFGGGGPRGRSPEETAAIQRQHSQGMAVQLAPLIAQAGFMTITDKAAFFKELKALIDWFDSDIQVGVKRAKGTS